MTARTAVEPTGAAGAGAHAATSTATARIPRAARHTERRSNDTSSATQRSGSSGSAATSSGPVPTSAEELPTQSSQATSGSSGEASGGSTRHWRTPRSAREFSAQANRVATMLLNGEIDRDLVQQYSAVARTMVQAISAEVYRARILKEVPDLGLSDEELFDE